MRERRIEILFHKRDSLNKKGLMIQAIFFKCPRQVCSELHSSLKQGKYGTKEYLLKNLIETRGIAK